MHGNGVGVIAVMTAETMVAGGEKMINDEIVNVILTMMIPEITIAAMVNDDNPRNTNERRVAIEIMIEVTMIVAVEAGATAEIDLVGEEKSPLAKIAGEIEVAVQRTIGTRAPIENDRNVTTIHHMIQNLHNNNSSSSSTGSFPTFVYVSYPKRFPSITSKRELCKMSSSPTTKPNNLAVVVVVVAPQRQYYSWTMMDKYSIKFPNDIWKQPYQKWVAMLLFWRVIARSIMIIVGRRDGYWKRPRMGDGV